jgi:hypothetical protein
LPCASLFDDEIISEENLDLPGHRSLRRNSSDPNLTLISVFSPDAPAPQVEVNVQRSSSSAASARSSHVFSLFKFPKERASSVSISNTQLLQTVDGSISVDNKIKVETIVDASKKETKEKNNRFISFVRYIFCQFVPLRSNAVVTPATNNETANNNNNNNDCNQVPQTQSIAQIENDPKVKKISYKFSY